MRKRKSPVECHELIRTFGGLASIDAGVTCFAANA